MSTRRWGCLALIIAPIVAAFLVIKIPEWNNDARLNGLRERVNNYPLPAKTERIKYSASETEVGKMGPTGDYCDYRVRLTFWSTLADEEIRRYYAAARIPGVDKGMVGLRLWFADRTSGAPGRMFILEAFDRTPAGMDLRCS